MEKTLRARHGEWAQSFHAPSKQATPPNLHVLTNLEALLLDFYGGFIT